MSDAVHIEFPHADAAAMFRQMERAQQALGKSAKQSVRLAGWHLCRSLGASTKIGKDKLRTIVANPDRRGQARLERGTSGAWEQRKADLRRAAWGMYVYFGGNGAQKFVGIRRKGGRGSWGSKSQSTTWEDVTYIDTKAQAEAQVKRRTIGRRGLAKGSWLWAGKHLGSGGSGGPMKVRNAIRVHWAGGDVNPSLTVTNRLRYIFAALAGGAQAVETAMGRASRAMEYDLDAKIRKSELGK